LLNENPLFAAASCQKTDNILQLNLDQELRFIIAKDAGLQAALTQALPEKGPHGILWSGVHWPSLNSFLALDERIHSMFIFLKTGERPPELPGPAREAVSRKWELYNWQIRQIPGIQILKNNVFAVRALSRHELDADKRFDVLRRAFKAGRALPWQALDAPALNGKTNTKKDVSVYRPFSALRRSSQAHFASLLKFVLPGLKGRLFLTSPWDFDYLWPAALLPLELELWPADPVQQDYVTITRLMFRFQAEELSRTISRFISDLRRLLLTSPVAQADLFFGNLEGEFAEYWKKEKQFLQEHTTNLLEVTEQKTLAAAVFLIHSKAFAGDAVQKALLRLALAQALLILLNKKNKPEFIQLLHHTLREFYLDFYTYRHMAGLIQESPQKSGAAEPAGNNGFLDGVMADFDFTADDRKKRFRRLVDMLVYNKRDTGKHSFVPHGSNGQVPGPAFDTQTAALLGQYCVSILIHHQSKNNGNRAHRMQRMWLELFYFLKETARRLRSGGRMALALDNGSGAEQRMEWRRVIESFLQNGLKDSGLKLLDISPGPAEHGESCPKTFLFFEKTSKES